MSKQFLIPVFAVCLLAACSQKYNPAKTPFAIYKPISEDNVRSLEKGVTTPTDVVKLFGNPAKNNISDKGERYVYGYLGDTLIINFDSARLVDNFLYRPDIFSPVSGNTDNMNKKISQSKVSKIKIYNDNIHSLEEKFKKANKKETGANRNRYTFNGKNGVLTVYTLADMEERVLSYSFTPVN